MEAAHGLLGRAGTSRGVGCAPPPDESGGASDSRDGRERRQSCRRSDAARCCCCSLQRLGRRPTTRALCRARDGTSPMPRVPCRRFPVLLANGFIEFFGGRWYPQCRYREPMMIDWHRCARRDVTHWPRSAAAARPPSCRRRPLFRAAAAAAVAAPGPLCARRRPPRRRLPLLWTSRPHARQRVARAGRERPARLRLDLACALLAFSRLRAGGGSNHSRNTHRRTVTHTKPKLTRRQRKVHYRSSMRNAPLRRAHAAAGRNRRRSAGPNQTRASPRALQRPEVRAEAPRQEPLVEPRRRLLPRRRGHGGVASRDGSGGDGGQGLRASAGARAALADRRRWTTCSTTSRVPPGVGGTSSVTSSDDPNNLSCRRALPILSPFVSRGVRGASPPHALSRAAASPSSEKGEKGAAGARASNLTSVRCGSASVLSDPSSLPLSARPKPQEMLPMSVVSDMVDDGALSGALMSFVGVSSCGAAIAGARRTRRVWAAWSRSGRVPRARIAPRRPATARRGPGRKKKVRAPRFLQLFTPGNSRSARRGRPALHRRRLAHLLVRRGAATPAAARRAGSTSRQPLFHQRVRGRGWCHTRQKRQ